MLKINYIQKFTELLYIYYSITLLSPSIIPSLSPAILKNFVSSCPKITYNPEVSGVITYFKTVS